MRLVKSDEVPGSKPNEPENEDYLGDFDKKFVANLREHLAKIPSMSEEECLDVLIKDEGPNYVRSGRVGGSIVVVDKISEEGKEVLTNVRDYLKVLFERRIKRMKSRRLEEYNEAKKRAELANNPEALIQEIEKHLPSDPSERRAMLEDLLKNAMSK